MACNSLSFDLDFCLTTTLLVFSATGTVVVNVDGFEKASTSDSHGPTGQGDFLPQKVEVNAFVRLARV